MSRYPDYSQSLSLVIHPSVKSSLSSYMLHSVIVTILPHPTQGHPPPNYPDKTCFDNISSK